MVAHKITIENTETGGVFYFYVNGWDRIFDGEWLHIKFCDAKTNETYTMYEKISEGLNKKDEKIIG